MFYTYNIIGVFPAFQVVSGDGQQGQEATLPARVADHGDAGTPPEGVRRPALASEPSQIHDIAHEMDTCPLIVYCKVT
jgi:hypothetical protein